MSNGDLKKNCFPLLSIYGTKIQRKTSLYRSIYNINGYMLFFSYVENTEEDTQIRPNRCR